jgi:hypothetical protein
VRAARETSVATALPVLLPGDTPSPLIPEWVREALGRLLGAFSIPRGTDVLQASGLHDAHARHKEAAGEWGIPAVTVLRRIYGWLHLALVKAPLKTLDWVAESPARLVAAVILAAACTHWL